METFKIPPTLWKFMCKASKGDCYGRLLPHGGEKYLNIAILTRWKSYTAPEKTVLMTNVQDSVFQLFQRVENKHGWMLVSHALAYVTAVSQHIGH